jgi:hypothetical protein
MIGDLVLGGCGVKSFTHAETVIIAAQTFFVCNVRQGCVLINLFGLPVLYREARDSQLGVPP